MGKCLVMGSTVCDVMMYLDRLPQREGDVHLHRQELTVGGCAFNVALLLHKLGLDYDFISPVGSGLYGDFVAGRLNQLGFDLPLRVSKENGCCYCFVEEDGERTFLSYHGAEYLFQKEWIEAKSDCSYDVIYFCGLEVEEETGADLVAGLTSLSGQLVFAPGPRGHLIAPNLLEKIYALSPIVHLNEQEVQTLTGKAGLREAVLALHAQTAAPVIVTKGAAGTLAYDGEWLEAAGYPSQVVDTIGAGDSHVSAIMAALSRGKSLLQALDFANQVASRVVASAGSQLTDSTYQQLSNLLEGK